MGTKSTVTDSCAIDPICTHTRRACCHNIISNSITTSNCLDTPKTYNIFDVVTFKTTAKEINCKTWINQCFQENY